MISKQNITALVVVFLAFTALYAYAPQLEVPTLKNLTSENLECIDRGTILGRGQSWVDQRIPFNGGATHDGYRQDPGGFVSMAWSSARPGATSSSLGSIARNIGKDELQGGDAMNCEGKHTALFAGWADGSRSQYVTLLYR